MKSMCTFRRLIYELVKALSNDDLIKLHTKTVEYDLHGLRITVEKELRRRMNHA